MPDIYETSQSYRARLLKREKRAAKRIIAAYAVAARRLVDDLRDLTDQIEAARLRGDLVNEAWLMRQERYQVLLFQIQREISRIASYAGILITNAQKDAVNLAIRDSANLTAVVAAQAEVVATFNRIAPSAVEALTGTLADGSPLKSLLDELPRHARTAITETLIQGVTLGWNPRKTAREMKAALNGNMARALRISRTETIRAYREATRASYQANSDIISAWRWTASKSRRTCLACLSRDGTIYPLEKPMPQHVNCRCSLIPILIDAPLPDIETGAEWFAKQPDKVKQEMMPGIAWDDFKAGRITLKDFEGRRFHARWGESVYQRSYREIERGMVRSRVVGI